MFIVGLITLTNGYAVFFDFNIGDFLAAYITLPIVLALYVVHRIYSYFWVGRKRWLNPLESFDFSKLELVEEEQRNTPQPIPKNAWEKFLNVIF